MGQTVVPAPTVIVPSGMVTLYEVDFATLPTQELAAGDGVKVIDGKSWTVAGTAAAAGGQLQIVNGTGWVNQKGNAFAGTILAKTKLTNLAAVKPWTDVVEVWARVVYNDVGTGNPGVAVNQCATEMRAEEATSPFTPNLQYHRAQVQSTATAQVQRKHYINYKAVDKSQAPANIEAVYQDVVCFRATGPNYWTIELGSWAGGWPAPEALTYCATCDFIDTVTSPLVCLGPNVMNGGDLAFQWFVSSSAAAKTPGGILKNLRVRRRS